MKKISLSAALLIMVAAMTGCIGGSSYTACTVDTVEEDCAMEYSSKFMPDMVCNTDVSPQEECNKDQEYIPEEGLEMMSWLDLTDCSTLSDVPGICEVDYSWPDWDEEE